MNLSAKLTTRLAALLLAALILLPAEQAFAQIAVDLPGQPGVTLHQMKQKEFSCKSAQTIKEDLGMTYSSAQFVSKTCVCADSAEAVKARLRSLANKLEKTGTKAAMQALGPSGQYEKVIEVAEGKTEERTIYCYDVSVIEALSRDRSR